MPARSWTVSAGAARRSVRVTHRTLTRRTEVRVDGDVVARDVAASLDGVGWRWRTSVELAFMLGPHRCAARVRPGLLSATLSLAVDGRDPTGGPAAPLERPWWIGGGGAAPRSLLPAGAPPLAFRPPTVAARLRSGALLVFGLAIFLLATMSGDLQDDLRFLSAGVPAVAEIEVKIAGGAVAAPPEIGYRYTALGRTYAVQEVVSDAYWQDARAPAQAPMRYLADAPAHARLDGGTDEWRRVELTLLAAAATLLVTARFLAAARHREMAAERVWRRGTAVDAVVVGFDRLSRRGPDRGYLWSVRYRYRDASLRPHEGTSEYLIESDAARYAPGDRVGVLHDPRDPGASVWAGAGA